MGTRLLLGDVLAHGGGHALAIMDSILTSEPPEDDSCRLLSGEEEKDEGEAVVSGSDPETVSSTSSESASGGSHCEIIGNCKKVHRRRARHRKISYMAG